MRSAILSVVLSSVQRSELSERPRLERRHNPLNQPSVLLMPSVRTTKTTTHSVMLGRDACLVEVHRDVGVEGVKAH